MNKLPYVNCVLFLFQFEFIGEENLSIYRLFIFPLLLYISLRTKFKLVKKDAIPFSIITLFLVFQLISLIIYKDFTSIIQILGEGFCLFIFYAYFRNNKIKISTLWTLSTYSLFHLIYFIKDLTSLNLSNRFKGYHWDPNYVCLYIIISFWSKIYILKEKKNIHLSIKLILLILILVDPVMILYTMSKGGIFALIISGIIFLFVYMKKVFYISCLSITLMLSWALNHSNQLIWSTDMNVIDSVTYRFITESEETGDISTGRIDFIKNYIYMIKNGDGVLLGMPIQNFINIYNNNFYPHNSILEILISSGLIFGSIFVITILYLIYLNILNIYTYKTIPFEIIISFSSLIVIMFLTFTGLKISWVFVALYLSLANNKKFYLMN